MDEAKDDNTLPPFPPLQLREELSVFESIQKETQGAEKKGSLVSFIGPSGSGKTSLINYLSGQSFSLEQSDLGFYVAVPLENAKASGSMVFNRLGALQTRELGSRSSTEELMRLKFEISLSASHALVVVLDYPSLMAGRGIFLSAALELLSNIFKDVQSDPRSRYIIFVMTKAPQEFGEQAFHRLIDAYFEEWGKRLLKIMGSSQRGGSLETSKQELESIRHHMEFIFSAKESFALIVVDICDSGESRSLFFERIDLLLSKSSSAQSCVLTQLRSDALKELSQLNAFFQLHQERCKDIEMAGESPENGLRSPMRSKQHHLLKIQKEVAEKTQALCDKDKPDECLFRPKNSKDSDDFTVEAKENDDWLNNLKFFFFRASNDSSGTTVYRAINKGVYHAIKAFRPDSPYKFDYANFFPDTPPFLRAEPGEQQGWEMVAEHIVPNALDGKGNCYWHIKWNGSGEGLFRPKILGKTRDLHREEIQELRDDISVLQKKEIGLRWEIECLKDEPSFQAVEEKSTVCEFSDQERMLQQASEEWLEQSKKYFFSLRALVSSLFLDSFEKDSSESRHFSSFSEFLDHRWPMCSLSPQLEQIPKEPLVPSALNEHEEARQSERQEDGPLPSSALLVTSIGEASDLVSEQSVVQVKQFSDKNESMLSIT